MSPPDPAARLTDLETAEPGLARWLHGLLPGLPPLPDLPRVLRRMPHWRGRALRRLALRVTDRAGELARAAVDDALTALRGRPDPVLRMEAGEASRPGRRSVALYVHYAPSGAVSAMVRRQLETYDRLGFETVFISNAPALPEADWQAARARVALVVHRRNFGLDFGAWKDLCAEALRRWPDADELLLVNDSVLGPLRPLDPVLAAMRAEGEGLFGLLESLQGGPHLQSWFLLARGRRAVADLAGFLGRVRLSASKWRIIQRGELRLARQMRRMGHRVAAVHAYRHLLDLALADPAERSYLLRAIPHLADLALLPEAAAVERLRQRLIQSPLNPAHHLWRVLNGPAGCPFLKAELVRKNPGELPEVDHWPTLVPPDAPCPPAVIAEHLAGMGSLRA